MLLGGRRVVRRDFCRELHPHCCAGLIVMFTGFVFRLGFFVTKNPSQVDKKVESTVHTYVPGYQVLPKLHNHFD
jgi:hypothetical protein